MFSGLPLPRMIGAEDVEEWADEVGAGTILGSLEEAIRDLVKREPAASAAASPSEEDREPDARTHADEKANWPNQVHRPYRLR